MRVPVGGTGPEPIPRGRGKEWLSREEPLFHVTLDAGTFDWLWRIVEAKCLVHHNDAHVMEQIPEQVAVSVKAVLAFREAAGTIATDSPVPPSKKIKRKVEPPPPLAKNGRKR